MKVLPIPCQSCPYRVDCPSGVWHAEEYAKLAEYDEQPNGQVPALTLFLCHQTTAAGEEIACRGWLTVHQNSVAVRLAMLKGHVTPEQVYAPPTVTLHASGAAAQAAGVAKIKRPGKVAKMMIDKLVKRGVGKPE